MKFSPEMLKGLLGKTDEVFREGMSSAGAGISNAGTRIAGQFPQAGAAVQKLGGAVGAHPYAAGGLALGALSMPGGEAPVPQGMPGMIDPRTAQDEAVRFVIELGLQPGSQDFARAFDQVNMLLQRGVSIQDLRTQMGMGG